MGNEFTHKTVGDQMTQTEFEDTTLHVFNSQAIGDIPYASSTTQISRLGIGTEGKILGSVSGIPAWIVPGSLGATYYIIANDAPAIIKTWATYMQSAGYNVWVCDGASDDVQVQAAIDAGIASGISFTCVLLPGSYTFSGIIDVNVNGFYHLVKISAYGAKITYTGGAAVGVFYIHDNTVGGVYYADSRLILEGFSLLGNDSGTVGIYLKNMTLPLLQDLVITGFASSNSRWAIYITDSAGGQSELTTIRRCHILDNTAGVAIYSPNGGAANFRMDDCVLSNVNVANANSMLLNLSGGTVARSLISNTSFHLGGAAGQIAVYIDINVNGMIFINPGIDNHSATNAATGFYSTALADGTLYIDGLQGSTSGGTLTFVDFTLGSLTPQIRGSDSYVTENSGVASNVTLDASGIGAIAHGCSTTPTYANVICQSANLNVRVSSIDATNINIVVYDLNNAVVTVDTHDFYWEVK